MAGLYLCVCPATRSLCFHSGSNHPAFSFLAGSLSLLSITSGVSSEGIAPSVGRCWWAAICAFCWGSCPALSVLLICLPLQIYFTTRIATLLAVVFCLVNVDAMTRYNCKVCAFHICLCTHGLIRRVPKVVTIFVIVSEAFLMCLIYFRGKDVWNSGCFIV